MVSFSWCDIAMHCKTRVLKCDLGLNLQAVFHKRAWRIDTDPSEISLGDPIYILEYWGDPILEIFLQVRTRHIVNIVDNVYNVNNVRQE